MREIFTAIYLESGDVHVTCSDGKRIVPALDPANADWQALARWQAEGNEITPYTPPPITITDIKAEAGNRILERYPLHAQLNMNAEATALTEALVSDGSWTNEQAKRATELKADWAWITAVRVRSNELERDLSLVSGDLSDQANWPV
ncbi:MAG: hypothetical protein RLN89_08485 [Parvibaculum sp.]